MSGSGFKKWLTGWRWWLLSAILLGGYALYLLRPYYRAPVVALTSAENSVDLSHYIYLGSDGEIVGMDVDLARDIARRLGRRLEVRNMPFNELLDRLEGGEGEFAIGMLSITPDRKKRFAVSDPYDTQGAAFIYHAGKPLPTFATAREFKIAVQIGTTGEEILAKQNIPAIAFSTYAAAESAFLAGKVDVFFYDYQPLRALASRSGGKLSVGLFESFENYAVMVRKDCPDVLAAANAVIASRHQGSRGRKAYFMFLLSPLLGFLVVAVPMLLLAILFYRRHRKIDVGMLHAMTGVFSVVAVLLLVYGGVVITSRYRELVAEAREMVLSEAETCQIRLDRYLETFRDLAISGRDALQWIGGESASTGAVNRLLAEMAREPCRRYPDFMGYYGFYKNALVMSGFEGVGVCWDPPADYDPQKRMWYRAAKTSPGKLVTLPPYEDVATRKTVLTFASLLTDGVSCICVDVLLENLAEVVNSDRFHNGSTFVFSDRGDALVHPPSYPDGNWQEAADPQLREFFMKASASLVGSGTFSMDFGAMGPVLAYVERSKDGFVVVRAYSENRLISDHVWHFVLSCFIGVALFTLGSALAFILVRGMRRLNREALAVKNRELANVFQSEAARTYFFSNVSHDIRTPLNAILGYSQLLKAGVQDPREQTQALDAIVSSGNVLMQLVNDVLDLSKLESGKMEFVVEPTDVAALVNETVRSFTLTCEKKGINLLADIRTMPILYLVPQRIRQILFNLLGNAVKFTDKGSITVRVRWNANVFTLVVVDTGCGIAEKDLKRLMQPYFQVRGTGSESGTGLGLAICKQLAERMGGSLTVTSELGKGTTFTLMVPQVAAVPEASVASAPILPLAAPEPVPERPAESERTVASPAAVEETSAAAPSPLPSRVLIVDDSPLNFKVLEAMLTRLGVKTVVRANNGREALEFLRKGPVDVVLTDLWMPEMDGSTFVTYLRQGEQAVGKNPTPVFAVTADVEAVKKTKDFGFNGILLKPVTLPGLEKLLKS